MASISQPPLTGDPIVDAHQREITDAINTLQIGNVISTERIITTNTVNGQSGPAGLDGLNRATIRVYQRTSLGADAGLVRPDRIPNSDIFRFSYDNLTLLRDVGGGIFTDSGPWEGWTDFIPERDPVLQDDFVWFQEVNISDRRTFDTFFGTQFSAVTLLAKPGLGALRASVSYEPTVISGETASTMDGQDGQDYQATIRKLYLGEFDVTGQIPAHQICWLIAEDTGEFQVDAQGFTSQADLDTALTIPDATRWPTVDYPDNLYTDRNFFNAAEPAIDMRTSGPRHVGYTTAFAADEIFSLTGEAGLFHNLSREIEPRVDIDNVINI